ncbi:polyadenylate-binding protein-interacting protein 2B-like [Artemia franciscana]|uniref:Ataxin-2 C-terminal domain-containing protein n=1 Tax=Artemia franciscana TaxID=6661 RepID=A0AA88HT14_ARTSF|nr:hypothetical protein QYM36_013850 [Artemia franciscana]
MKGPNETNKDPTEDSNDVQNGSQENETKNGEAGNGVAIQAPEPEDFSEYMWMANEEEFERQVLQQLEEEALMEECMLESFNGLSPGFEPFPQQDQMMMFQPLVQQPPVPSFQIPFNYPNWSPLNNENPVSPDTLAMNMVNLALSQNTRIESQASRIESQAARTVKLNPEAAEFVPRFGSVQQNQNDSNSTQT